MNSDWTTVIARFVLDQQSLDRAARTIDNRVALVRRLARETGKTVVDIDADDLVAHLTRGIAGSSMARERADFQAFFRFLVERGIRPDDPSARLKPIKVTRNKPRPYSIEQIEAMLATGSYRRTRVMIMLAYLHGMRAHEIAKVHSSDFDLRRGVLTIIGKGHKEREVPIHPRLAAEIANMPEGYWFPARGTNSGPHMHWRSVSDLMTRAKKRAEITNPRLTGHSLRHAFGTQLVWAGADLRTAQELLGHASLATTQIYTDVSEERKIAAIIALPVPEIPTKSGRRRRNLPEAA